MRGLSVRALPGGYLTSRPCCFFVGCHGGAGTTTLRASFTDSYTDGQWWGYDCGQWWPAPDPEAGGVANVVMVARTHATGLRAAQHAARVWAEGSLPPTVHLLGLALIADAPGRLPKPLRHLVDLISGGVPKVWSLPWVEDLRLGDPADQVALPPPYTAMAADLHALVHGAPHA